MASVPHEANSAAGLHLDRSDTGSHRIGPALPGGRPDPCSPSRCYATTCIVFAAARHPAHALPCPWPTRSHGITHRSAAMPVRTFAFPAAALLGVLVACRD